MKNYLSEDFFDLTKQLFRKMRTTLIMIVMFTSSLLAINVNSQVAKVSFSFRSANVFQVLDAIESQTDYLFVYNRNEVDLNLEVNMDVKNQPVTSVLNGIFQNTGITYAMEGNNIMLMQKIENQQQQKSVSGKVSDSSGSPLPGVSVVLKGTTNGSITDSEGNYSISGSSLNSILQFSFVGMKMQEIAVGVKTTINVTLLEDAIGIEEVVAIGYGTMKKSDLTGAISVVKGDAMTMMPTANFEQGMQGKVPGLIMKQTSAEPGGGISVSIRGTNSLSGSNEPLYVIDGFPIQNDNTSRPGGFEAQRPLNMLSNLNPNDIESVQVLKDASATSIYGSRGANGVIIITTKKGKSGKGSIDFDYSHSMAWAKSPIELCNIYDYARIENEGLANTGSAASLYRYTKEPNSYVPGGNVSPEQLRELYGEGTNWVDAVLQPGSTDNYNLAFYGGNNRTTYHFSANFYNERGVILKSDYLKGTIRANIATQVTDKLKVDVNVSQSRFEADRFQQTGRILGGGPDRIGTITQAFRANPIATPNQPLSEHNQLTLYTPGNIGQVTSFTYNPVLDSKEIDNSESMNFTMASLNIDYSILDELKLTFRGGANLQGQERINFMPTTTSIGRNWKGIGSHNFWNKRDFVFENFINYNKTFAEKHNLNATVGYSIQAERSQNVSLSGQGYAFDVQGIYGWAQLTNPTAPSVDEMSRRMASFYARLFYNFNDRYMVTLTAREDGSSVFAANKKWAFFPSAAVGWVMTQESFMSEVKWLSNLKWRASYGIVGNQAISPYQSISKLGSVGYVFGSTKDGALSPLTPANPDLVWESTKQFDAGFDASFLDNRIRFSADYYKKNTVDLLQNKPVPSTTGYTNFTTNFGEISNTGVELMLGGTILTGKLKWDSNLTWSLNRSRIENLGVAPDGTPIKYALTPASLIADGRQTHRFVVGEPAGTFWGYTHIGNLQQEDIDAKYPTIGTLNKIGMMKFKDLNSDGKITALDMGPIGNAQPDFTFGFDNTWSYKNWTLNMFINGVIGSEMFNMMAIYTSLGGVRQNGGRHSQAYVDDYWTPENLDAKYPIPSGGLSDMNSFLIEDASFIRLQTLALNYTIPLKELGVNWISNASIYARGTNLYVWTNYSGFDPEGGFSGQASYAPNIDLGNYPRPRTIEFGVKIGF